MNERESSTVPEIIAELQAEVRRHQRALTAEADGVARSDADPLARVRFYQHVNSHLPIGWPDMPPGFLPKLRAYAQKITRRLLRWYINPLVDQQNRFNTAVTEALVNLSLQVERHERMLQALAERVPGDSAHAGPRDKGISGEGEKG